MTSLSEIRQSMLRIEPSLGEVHSLASAGAQTATITALATGKLTSGKYVDKYIVRPDAATAGAADRVRICTSFNSSTGALTHAGTAYTDQTATGEKVELHVHHPRLLDQAIDLTLGKTLRSDSVELPILNSSSRYWLNSLPFIKKAADIKGIECRPSKQISRNRYFDKWNSYNTSGVLQPDFWTLSGSGATMARSTTQTWRSGYSLAITRSSNNATLTQVVGLLETGVSADSLRGKTVTVAAYGWSTEASQLRIGVNDGVTTTYSDYHAGDEVWAELSKQVTVSSLATKLDIIAEVNGSDSVAYLGELYLVTDQLTDNDRRDANDGWDTIEIRSAEQSASLPIELPTHSYGRSYRVWVERPYPQLDNTRLDDGTADDDTIDAPKELIAVGALARLYEQLSHPKNEDTERYQQLAFKYQKDFEPMQRAHVYRAGTEHGARKTFGRSYVSSARVMRYR